MLSALLAHGRSSYRKRGRASWRKKREEGLARDDGDEYPLTGLRYKDLLNGDGIGTAGGFIWDPPLDQRECASRRLMRPLRNRLEIGI